MAGKYDLALEEARRELSRQSADLSSLRDRSVTLLGIGGTLASILGGLAIRDGREISPFTVAAVGAFCALSTVTVVVLWPRKVEFGQNPSMIIKAADVPGATTDDLVKHLAEQMNAQYGINKPKVDDLVWWYCGAVVLFVVEVVALLLDLRGR
ncbi:hypothetical protein GCM10023350_53070 [Nocardioides endophyticus]|uniref:Peptidase n=1 Tax=Nocardioides endophyticus TaxID=1353775 RepID=A0ABP8ZMU5_9ACTN